MPARVTILNNIFSSGQDFTISLIDDVYHLKSDS